jgi:hypothetical protein
VHGGTDGDVGVGVGDALEDGEGDAAVGESVGVADGVGLGRRPPGAPRRAGGGAAGGGEAAGESSGDADGVPDGVGVPETVGLGDGLGVTDGEERGGPLVQVGVGVTGGYPLHPGWGPGLDWVAVGLGLDEADAGTVMPGVLILVALCGGAPVCASTVTVQVAAATRSRLVATA